MPRDEFTFNLDSRDSIIAALGRSHVPTDVIRESVRNWLTMGQPWNHHCEECRDGTYLPRYRERNTGNGIYFPNFCANCGRDLRGVLPF